MLLSKKPLKQLEGLRLTKGETPFCMAEMEKSGNATRMAKTIHTRLLDNFNYLSTTTMHRNIVRVLPKRGDWKVTYNSIEVRSFILKSAAIEYGKNLAKSHAPSQLVIHKADGTIETEYTYGNDPYPPRG